MENNKLKEAMEEKGLKTKVFEALGEVSMCWSETPKGIFESSRAEEIGSRLMKDIQESHRNTIFDTLESVGRQQFMENIQEKENYEVVSGRFTTKGVSIIEDDKPSLEEAIEVLCNALREDEKLYNKIVLDFENATINYIKDNHVNWMDIEVCDNEKFKNILNTFTKNFLNLLINK